MGIKWPVFKMQWVTNIKFQFKSSEELWFKKIDQEKNCQLGGALSSTEHKWTKHASSKQIKKL